MGQRKPLYVAFWLLYLSIPKQTQRKPNEEGLPRPVLDDIVETTNAHVLKGSLSPVETLESIVWWLSGCSLPQRQ